LGNFLPYTDYPVIRAWAQMPRSAEWGETLLFDLKSDPAQTVNLAGTAAEAGLERLMVETLEALDSPPSQFERLGLT